ncbi:MAG: DUF3761 domain-containing protein [Patescibacteria group bacterium]|jgi:hypothetical protein
MKTLFKALTLILFVITLSGCVADYDTSLNSSNGVRQIAPVVQEVERATAVEVSPVVNEAVSTPAPVACGSGYYKNIDGNCVHVPSSNPSGASAKCRDGSYSYSQHRQGTCSGHGGVAQWLY